MMTEFKLVKDLETNKSLLYIPFYTINDYVYNGYFVSLNKACI